MIIEDTNYYIEGVLEGNRRVIAKTITIVESSLPDHQKQAKTIIDSLLPYSGKAVRIGITGVPGVGKSAFIESFGMMLLKNEHRIAVLAVDPSSKKSGGSVMGDKTRMVKLSVGKHVYTAITVRGNSWRCCKKNQGNNDCVRSCRF